MDLSVETLQRFRQACDEAKEESLADLVDRLADKLGPGPHMGFDAFLADIQAIADEHDVKVSAKQKKLVQTGLTSTDENAEPVIKKIHKPGKDEADSLYGRFETEIDGKACVIEYEPDTELRDTEQVPLLEDGGIETFFRREVLPHVPDAWIDDTKTRVGYAISFTRYFYKPQKLRTLDEIVADIRALEAESEGLLEQILEGEGG